MDGNGRWAQKRFHPRVWGHIRGSHRVSEIVERADDLGIKSLTLYAFSTENWSRPTAEINTLMKLLGKFLKKERARIIKNKIKFKIIGEKEYIPKEVLGEILELEETTKDFTGLKLTFAFSYGSRTEILNAVNNFMRLNPGKNITETDLKNYLYNTDVPEIDLLIRTGGDQRISNFLLWQIAYSELYFTTTFWPDFSSDVFEKIITEVSQRERRFGNIAASENLESNLKIAEKKKTEILTNIGAK